MLAVYLFFGVMAALFIVGPTWSYVEARRKKYYLMTDKMIVGFINRGERNEN
jgi:hypothetical protein